MKIKNYVLFLFFFYNGSALAQSLKGTVKSQSGESLSYATIVVLNSARGTIADKEGKFSLELGQGTFQIQFTAVGFASKVQSITISATPPALDIVLLENTQVLSEVVVTANKREEDIVKVSTSITSLSAKKLEDTRTWGLSGLTALVPNYSYQELGVPFQQIQSIRGIQAFSENPAVATYIDDVNNLDILANGFALTDIERIEVLRGPQGTLFGRNAMGGVVNIITKKPTNQTTGFTELSAGNLGLQRYSGGVKSPLVKDKLFFGLTGLYQTREGYFKNDTTGTGATEGSVNGRAIGGEKNVYGNLFLKWLPTHRLSLTLNIKGQRDWSDNTGFMLSQPSDAIGFAHPDKIYLRRIGQHERKILNNSLVLKYFGEGVTFTSISAYQTIRMGYKNIDFPGFYSSFYDKTVGELLPPQQVYSQEFRINSNSDRKQQYTGGLYGFTQKGYEPTTNAVYELSDAEAPYYGLPAGSFIIYRNRSNNYGLAAFGELNYQVAPKLKVTGGLRYDNEHREATFNGFGDAALVGGVVTNFKADTTAKGNYSALSPKATFSYAVNGRSNIYATYTRGFRAGGINSQRFAASSGVKQTFDPEYSNNYEVGYKTNLPGNRLSLGASAFVIQWQNLQLYNLVAPFTYARENVGDAQSAGVELEISSIPVNGLQLDATLGLNQTEYKNFELKRVDYSTGIVTKTQVSGNSLSNTPSHTIFFGAQYEAPITKGIKAIVRGEVRNIGKYHADIQNAITQSSYSMINTRIGLVVGKYSLFFWGQNLNNARYLAYGNSDSSFGRSVIMASPRTYGITLGAKF
jgi:iron complex outermembrane receptor protein